MILLGQISYLIRPGKVRATLCGLSLLFGLNPALASEDLGQIWRNNEAVTLQGQEKMIESFEAFAKLLGENPFDFVFQFNMGTGFLTTEDVEKAKQLFEQLNTTKDLPPELQFYVAYNLGVINGSTGNVDSALEAYQKALEFQPDSQEIKTNIELLIQKKKGGGGGKDKKKQKGKGKGSDKKKSDKPDEGDKDEEEKEPQQMQNQNPGYKGKEMSKGDVKKILEELKNQEQKIRAKHDRKGKREKDREKNW